MRNSSSDPTAMKRTLCILITLLLLCAAGCAEVAATANVALCAEEGMDIMLPSETPAPPAEEPLSMQPDGTPDAEDPIILPGDGTSYATSLPELSLRRRGHKPPEAEATPSLCVYVERWMKKGVSQMRACEPARGPAGYPLEECLSSSAHCRKVGNGTAADGMKRVSCLRSL